MVNDKTAALFDNWDEALIWSCLQEYGGTLLVNDERNPKSAIIDIGDFCFCAGIPDEELLASIYGFKLFIPKDEVWESLIESYFGDWAKKLLRYAIKKESDIFHTKQLYSYINSLDDCYELKLLDEEIFQLAQNEKWSADLCSQFKDYTDYQNRAIGVAI